VPSGTPGPLPTGAGGSELDRLRTIVAAYFPVYETRIGPQSVLLAVHLDPATLEGKFDALRRELWTLQYVPLLRRQLGEDFVEVVRRPTPKRSRQWINLILLAATILTTSFAGALIWIAYVGGSTFTVGDFANGALYFAAPVLLILGLHELAHYAMARRHHVEASLPYFMPVPPPLLFGTLGAFISIREPFPDKKTLFDIGVAGPLTGFAASIPIALAGLYLSIHAPVVPANYCGPTILGVDYGNLLVGIPLFWYALKLFFPAAVALSPLALAGWVGILITAINLLPMGQLDGGHVWRALFGDRVRYVSYAGVVLLFGIGILFYAGWLFFALLILVLGMRHPPPLNDITPLDTKRIAVGVLTIGVLVTGFVLTPLAVPPGQVDFPTHAIDYAGGAPSSTHANLTATLDNQDPVPHGFLLTVTLANATVPGSGNSTTNLTGPALTAWATSNVTWTFYLPNGRTYSATGVSASLPASDFLTVNATTDANVTVGFASASPVLGAGISLATTEYCAQSGSGTASVLFTPRWS
jgi:membrane-associated protease RseP (regulator of RpoE activity)